MTKKKQSLQMQKLKNIKINKYKIQKRHRSDFFLMLNDVVNHDAMNVKNIKVWKEKR